MDISNEKLLQGARNLKEKGYTPQQVDDWLKGHGSSLEEMRSFARIPEVTPEIRAQVDANNQAYAQRQEENRPWLDKNPIGRAGVALAQGISNSFFNPAGHIARAFGMDTKPFKPENAVERGIELAGEYGYDAGGLGKIGSLAKGAGYLGKGKGVASKVAQTVLAPESTAQALATFIAPAAGGGLVEGITDPRNPFERTVANVVGSMIPAGIGGAVARTTTPVRGGLKNILADEGANATLSKGIRADKTKGVARQINKEAPAAYNEMNAEMSQALDDATGRKLNIDRALDTQQQRYNDFISKNADVELYSPKSAQEQSADNFNRWFEGSKVVDENGEPLKLYHGTPKKFDAFDKDKIVRGNGFWFTDDMNYASSIRANEGNPTVLETYLNAKNPIDVNKNREDFIKLSKEYFGNSQDFSDVGDKFIIGEAMSDKGFPEFLKSKGYDAIKMGNGIEVFNPNQIKSVNNSGAWSSSPSLSDAGWTPKASLKNFTQGLNEFQENALNQAINKGATMSTNAKGSLGATHRAQEVLNDMIDASYDTSVIGQRRPTTETRQLMTVKERLNQILEPSGVKPYDAGISKAKGLRANFEKGYNFKPSETKFENLGLDTLRDKRAFLQGRLAKLQDNVLSDGGTNLATAIKKDENTLRKLMPKSKFETLMNKADRLEENFKRLKALEGQANKEILKDIERNGSPWRENIESRGSMLGRALDIATGWYGRGAKTRLANQYLNPETTSITTKGGLKGLLGGAGSGGTRQLLIDLLNNGAE